jgi:hypothetical protein
MHYHVLSQYLAYILVYFFSLCNECSCTIMNEGSAFSKIKRGARIINVARGGVICEKSLLQALESGQVRLRHKIGNATALHFEDGCPIDRRSMKQALIT